MKRGLAPCGPCPGRAITRRRGGPGCAACVGGRAGDRQARLRPPALGSRSGDLRGGAIIDRTLVPQQGPVQPPWLRSARLGFTGFTPQLRHVRSLPSQACWRVPRLCWTATSSAANGGDGCPTLLLQTLCCPTCCVAKTWAPSMRRCRPCAWWPGRRHPTSSASPSAASANSTATPASTSTAAACRWTPAWTKPRPRSTPPGDRRCSTSARPRSTSSCSCRAPARPSWP